MNTNRHPLRRVVGYIDHKPLPDRDTTVRHELLECGHHRPPKQDHYGETNAMRRRCSRCARAVLAEVGR